MYLSVGMRPNWGWGRRPAEQSTAVGTLQQKTENGGSGMRASNCWPLKRQVGQGRLLSVLDRTAGATHRSYAGVYCAVAVERRSGMWCTSRAEEKKAGLSGIRLASMGCLLSDALAWLRDGLVCAAQVSGR